jgi:anaerobic magnesium-protoporphyrin IX monomethyl ester cyclase
MTDILLAHAYYLSRDPAEQRVMRPYVPLGILSIAAYLDSAGWSTSVFDATFRTPEDFAQRLSVERPPVVGIYVNMMTKTNALMMAAAAKRLGAFVIVGGPEPPFYADEFLARNVDAVVVGEGEHTTHELLSALRSGGRDLSRIQGIVFRSPEGNVIRTSPRPHIGTLDDLPFPDRTKVDMDEYLRAWREHRGSTSLSMVTMRGCPFTCTWCSHAVYGESYRRRSAPHVVRELRMLDERYHPDAYWFADDVFTINHAWLFAFADELRKEQLAIRYECITRADRMNEKVVRALCDSGCKRLWIGSESGSQRILDAMSRRVSVEQVQAMTHLAQANGIEVGMFIMLGYAGETREDVEATIRHVRACRPDHLLTTVAYPIKGTAFYSEVRDRLVVPRLPFEQWNDRMIGITGRYSRRFYWFANRRVVNEAAWIRSSRSPNRSWGKAAVSYIKAKAAQAFMAVTS